MDPQEVCCVTGPRFYCQLRRFLQLLDFLGEKVKCIVCFEIFSGPYRYAFLSPSALIWDWIIVVWIAGTYFVGYVSPIGSPR